MGKNDERGRVRVLHEELQALLHGSDKTIEEVRRETHLHRDTTEDMLAGRGRFRVDSVAKFVRCLGATNVYGYVHPADRPGADAAIPREPERSTRESIHEWEEVETLSPVLGTSNGLQYQIFRMQHRDHPGYLGRGKQYNLRFLKAEERESKRECLLRHPEICRRLVGRSQFPINEKVASLGDGRVWWVIDRWAEGVTLEERLQSAPLQDNELRHLVTDIAEALQTLHENQIIRRELAPAFILLEKDTKRVVLTDFELGKLLDGSPTVRGVAWRHEEYLAPEVLHGKPDFRADLYSWARIGLKAVLHELPAPGHDQAAVGETRLPRGVRAVMEKCLKRKREQRPESMAEVLKVVRRWK